jgi:hypothetical protein
VIGPVTGRAVTVTVLRLLAWQEPIQRGHQVIIGAGTDLHDDQAGRGVRDEDRQEPLGGADVGQERVALGGEIGQTAARPGSDSQLAGVYGKMLRSASRSRPRPPRAGADS